MNRQNAAADWPKSELRKRKLKELKSQFFGQQSFFSQLTTKVKAATEASFRVSHFIVKNKKFFQDREMVKEAFVAAAKLVVFRDFKNKPEILSSIKVKKYSYTAQGSHGRGFDQATLEGYRGLRVFLTAIGRVNRREWHSPVVHFYSDDVSRYDCKRGAVNSTAHERTHARRENFSVFQKRYRENTAPSVEIGVHHHGRSPREGWPLKWIYCQVKGGRCFSRLPRLPLHNTPTSVMRKNAQHEKR